MHSHVHLIFRARDSNPSDLIRDFKGFTSRKMIKSIQENQQESRKEWLLWMFRQAGKRNSNIKEFQFWQQNNQPIEIWSLNVFEQKLNYVHENPVKQKIVSEPEHYYFISARTYADLESAINVEVVFMG